MENLKVVSVDDDNQVSSALLKLISKLSLTRPEDALRLLAMCAKDDLPKSSVLTYAIEVIERNDCTSINNKSMPN